MLFQYVEKNSARFPGIAFEGIEPREIQVGLIESWRNTDGFLKAFLRFFLALRSQIENTEVVEGFGVSGAGSQRLLEVFVGALRIVELRKYHAKAVVCFGVLGVQLESSPEDGLGILPAPLLTIGVPQIVQGNQVIGIYLKRSLKILDGLISASFTRCQNSQI